MNDHPPTNKRSPSAGGARGNDGDDAVLLSAPTLLQTAGAVKQLDAARAIEAALVAEPSLDAIGVGYRPRGRSDVDRRRTCSPLSPAGVATALEFLARCRPTTQPRLSSYSLKHRAENWGARHGLAAFVWNGELIVAAIALGLKIEKHFSSPNVTVGVERADVERLDPDWPWARRPGRRRRRVR